MDAVDILLSLGKRLEVWGVPDKEIAVSYEDCGIKDENFLIYTFGVGDTFSRACEDYLNKMHGKTLVFDACGKSREEVRVL